MVKKYKPIRWGLLPEKSQIKISKLLEIKPVIDPEKSEGGRHNSIMCVACNEVILTYSPVPDCMNWWSKEEQRHWASARHKQNEVLWKLSQ